jgi:protein-tyrosine phosphatase
MIRFPDIGVLNFRDMGGYSAADGRRTRWKLLYRSGATPAITSADLDKVAKLRIAYNYDLRSNAERAGQPSPLSRVQGIEYQSVNHDAISTDVSKLLGSADSRASHSKSLMIAAYRRMPSEFLNAYRALFVQLEAGNTPLLFNCTYGKDRTGVAAALILAALGISHEQILEDYLLSEQRFERSCTAIRESNAAVFRDTNREVWEPLMKVDADYLTAAFDEITATFGSVSGFLTNEVQVSAASLQRLRTHLLE